MYVYIVFITRYTLHNIGRYAAKVDQQIDSIKWYKDGREFYRLHPDRGGTGGVVRQFGVSSSIVFSSSAMFVLSRWRV